MDMTNAYSIDVCRGLAGECRNALPVPEELPAQLAALLEQSSWLQRLTALYATGLRPHHRFRLALSACANGCSRPQTADLGLLAAQRPLPPQTCSGCGACETACPDGLVCLVERDAGPAPEINRHDCLDCGLCTRACPEGLMRPGLSGLRVQVGGKLGRRPLLAAELPGILDTDAVLNVLQRSLQALVNANADGDPTTFRLAELRRRQGLAWLTESTCAP